MSGEIGFVCTVCVCMCVSARVRVWVGLLQVLCHNLHMAQLMSDGEGGTNSIFLTDGAAPVRVAHGPQLR